jgi:hypothetical protein
MPTAIWFHGLKLLKKSVYFHPEETQGENTHELQTTFALN